MAFWIVAASLTLLAMASIAVPFLRAPGAAASALDHDREIYRARIREIEADRELGRIGAAEAEAAKAEEGRKLIVLSQAAPSTPDGAGRVAPFVLAGALAFVPLATILFYAASGAPSMPDMAIASRPDRDLNRQTIEQLLQRAEAQLAANPNDARGWTVVAPVYMRLGRMQDAVTAWRNALRLQPGNADLMTSLGEAIAGASDGVVTEDSRRLFVQALEIRPKDPKARFYLAIALGQQGERASAAEAWRELIAEAPADAPWLPVARAQLAAVGGTAAEAPAEAKAEPLAEAPAGADARDTPGPSEEDIAAASGMSPEDRLAMIETMVANLADRLEAEPQDRDGWRRLMRSYAVLGRSGEAQAAMAKARGHFAGDAEFLAELEAMAKQAGEATQ